MSRILRRRPSPSMIVALVALSVALAGTATALPGRARVKKDDISRAAVRSVHIKSRAIQSKHIKSRAVTRSKIAKRAISSGEVGQDALTGTNIVESSLATVPSASSATNAGKVNGRSVEKFAFLGSAGTGTTTVLTLNGLTLTAACSAGSELTVRATTAVSGALIHTGGGRDVDAAFYHADNAFNIGALFDVLDEGSSNSDALQGSLTYVRPDAEVVTATFMAEEAPGRCTFAGTATA
jgi:hypothetical protein